MANPGTFPSDWNSSPTSEPEDSPSSLKYLNEAASLGFRPGQVSWKVDQSIGDSSRRDRWHVGSMHSSGTSFGSWNADSGVDAQAGSSIWGDDQSSSHTSFSSGLFRSRAGETLDQSSNHTESSFNNSFSQLSVNASQPSNSSESYRDGFDPRLVVGPNSPTSSPQHQKHGLQSQDLSPDFQIPLGNPSTYHLFNVSNHTATTVQSTTSNLSGNSSVPGLVAAHTGSTLTTHPSIASQPWAAVPPGFDSQGPRLPPSSMDPQHAPLEVSSPKTSLQAELLASTGASTLQEREPGSPSSRRMKSREKQKRNRRKGGRGMDKGRSDMPDDASGKPSLLQNASEGYQWGSTSSSVLTETSTTSEAIRQLTASSGSMRLQRGMLDKSSSLPSTRSPISPDRDLDAFGKPILPEQAVDDSFSFDEEPDDLETGDSWENKASMNANLSPASKKKEWLERMTKKLNETPPGELDPAFVPVAAVMNAWAKTKSSQGASMVELWLKRAQQEYDMGNDRVVPTTKMYTMAGKFKISPV